MLENDTLNKKIIAVEAQQNDEFSLEYIVYRQFDR